MLHIYTLCEELYLGAIDLVTKSMALSIYVAEPVISYHIAYQNQEFSFQLPFTFVTGMEKN